MKHLVCSKIWTDINVNIPTKEIKNCCKREPSLHTSDDIKRLGRDVFIKNDFLMNDKKYFIEKNDFPDACSHCKYSHPSSIWQNWNEWKYRDWTESSLNSLLDADHTRNVEIMLSTTCNQTCIYCREEVSSEWAKLKGITPIIDVSWKEAILKSLYDYIECKLTFDFTPLNYNFLGGEPFLDLEIFKILDNIISIHDRTWGENSSRFVNFRFTTNLNIKRKTIENFLDVVRKNSKYNFSITASIDAVGTKGEIIRDGLNFQRFEENLNLIMSEPSIFRVDLLPTLSNLNVKVYPELLQWIIKTASQHYNLNDYGKKWKVGANLVTWPFELMPALCPPSYSKYLDEAADVMRTLPDSSFREEQVQYLIRVKEHVLGKQRYKEKIDDAIKFFQDQGNLKNKDYWELLPELNEILNYENLNIR